MEASLIIKQNKEQILERWLDKVSKSIPESGSHQYFSIRNSIPRLVDDLCQLLDGGKQQASLHSSKDHGERRSDFRNYSLMHVIREYRILKEVIFELLDEKNNVQPDERNKIMFIIDRAIEQAAEAFFMTRQDEKDQARQDAEKIAEDLQEEEVLRDNFFSGITHDLKNPISNITSAVSFLKTNEVTPETQTRFYDIIKVSAQRAEALIRDLLDINLIKSGNQLPLNLGENNLRGLIMQTVESLKPEQRKRIRLNLGNEEIVGQWDNSLLRRAVDNLLQNALKYGQDEKPITISISRDAQYTAIAIHNEGNPIPPEKRNSLFNRFFRADEQHASGWGLGLALVHGIAEAHHGTVELQSEDGKGTTFILKIPFKSGASHDSVEKLKGVQN